jgi:hypothetical protein
MLVNSLFRRVVLAFLSISMCSGRAFSQYSNSNYLPPERSHSATNITGRDSDYEYWDAAMVDGRRTPRESEPIDDALENLKNGGFSCLATRHVIWNGTAGYADGQLESLSRFAIECDGNCTGVRFRVAAQAIIYHLGLTQPVPVLAFKAIWLGNVPVKWTFTRPSATGDDLPDIYIHHWAAGSFNYGPGCRAPKSDNVAGTYSPEPIAASHPYGTAGGSATVPTESPTGTNRRTIPSPDGNSVARPQIQSSPSQVPLAGVYTGTFRCGAEVFNLRFTLTEGTAGALTATFDYSPLVPPTTQRFVFDMSGRLIAPNLFQLNPVRWETSHPRRYKMVAMAGTWNPETRQIDGQLSIPACGSFRLTSAGSQSGGGN